MVPVYMTERVPLVGQLRRQPDRPAANVERLQRHHHPKPVAHTIRHAAPPISASCQTPSFRCQMQLAESLFRSVTQADEAALDGHANDAGSWVTMPD